MTLTLHHEKVTAAADASPELWLYVLHGMYGSGRNWGSLVRKVVRARPEWGALLIDLRQHGGSQGFDPPHTVQAAAADLQRLADTTGIEPSAVLGHSFGGKVALVFAAGDSPAAVSLSQVWVIDSTPAEGQPGGSAWTMLQLLRDLPETFAARDDLIEALVGADLSRPVAQWMATNLEPAPGGFRWRFDLDAMEALLRSFFATDAWEAVERPRPGLEVHLVKAEDSSVLEGETLKRCEIAAQQAATQVHTVAGGHWVNAENPGAVETLLVQMLPR